MKHNHEPFPLTVPTDCPMCPQYPNGTPTTTPSTEDKRANGAAANDWAHRERNAR